MLVKQVLMKYHKLVPFPWTLPKISKAGYVPRDFFLALGDELRECEDVKSDRTQKTLRAIEALIDAAS